MISTGILIILLTSFSAFFFYSNQHKYSTITNLIYSGIFFLISSFIFYLLAFIGFSLWESAAIGIIGATDGPSTIFVGHKFSYYMLDPIGIPLILLITIFNIIFFSFYKVSTFSIFKSTIYTFLTLLILPLSFLFLFIYFSTFPEFGSPMAIGIIGGADGPTAIYIAARFLSSIFLPLIFSALVAIFYFWRKRHQYSLPKNFLYSLFTFIATFLFSTTIFTLIFLGLMYF